MAITIFWVLFALAAFLPVAWVVYLFFAGLAFGAFNTLPGGFNLIPYAATAPLLAWRLLGERGAADRLGDALLNPRRFGLLSAFILYALVITATAPALFQGVPVIGLNNSLEVPLHYGLGNLTQAIYLVAGWLVAISLFVLIRMPGGPKILGQALLLGGAMAVVAGLADLLSVGTGLLAPVRTAKYAIIDTAEIGPLHRVIGFNTEASSYGGLTLFFATSLLFIRPSRFAGRLCRMLEPFLTIALFVLSFLSTSSSAYLGLAAALVLYGGSLAVQAATASHSLEGHGAAIKLLILLGCLWVAGLAIVFHPSMATQVLQVINQAVFQKAGTDSYIERMSWSRVSMAAMVHSGGYGVGLGSTRASSFPVAVVASAGVFGAALLLAYFARCLMAPLARGRGWRAGPDARDTLAHGWAQAIVGARLAWLACLVPAASVATTVDMSLNALFFAIMATAGLAITTAEGSDSDAACPAPGGRAARRKQRLVGQRIPRAAHAATRDLGNSRMQRVPNAAGRCL